MKKYIHALVSVFIVVVAVVTISLSSSKASAYNSSFIQDLINYSETVEDTWFRPVQYWYENDPTVKYYLDHGFELVYVPSSIWIANGELNVPSGYVLYDSDGTVQFVLDRYGRDLETGEILIFPTGGGGSSSGSGGGRGGTPESATGNNYNYYTEVGDTITNNNNTTNNYNSGDTINGNVLNLQDGIYNDYTGGTVTSYNIESLSYNPDNSTYTVTTINNYTYNIQYTYNYTYVTYIGATAEYTESYAFYYELPDGRSSADLTADDIAGISLEFDVVNYDREFTDTHTRALFHFDGDYTDDSYYNPTLNWTKGGSITYLDSNAFDGCLFLSNVKHEFNVALSPSLFPSDFTVQFRIYFGGGTDIVSYNSYLNCGGLMFTWNNANFQFKYLNTLINSGSLSVGVWNDICLEAIGTNCYLYINGVRVASYNTGNALGLNNVQFSVDSNQQYLYLDELRIVDFAVYTANFTPSPVPYDTNNVFVLPDTDNLSDMTIAVQTDLPVSGYRVGGVRPTFPNKGMVFMPVDNSRVIDCQVYNGSYWESVEARLWTGERWIPLWSFDVVTLMDMYDIYGGDSVNAPINTETGFWSWFQVQWADFKKWYTNFSGGSAKIDVDKVVEEGSGFSLLGTLGDIMSSLVNMASSLVTTVFDGLFTGAASAISGFSDSFGSGGSVLDFATYEGVDIWD